ncbi:MAG: hypothetical protein ACK5KT_10165 [Dysgonomonas sp.]
MTTLQHLLPLLESYNSLLKYHIKAESENLSGEKRIDIHLENLPDLAAFREDILQKLESQDYNEDFVRIVNQLYQLSQTNSDLVATHSPAFKQLCKEYPFATGLETLSFGIYQFIRDEIFEAKNEYDRPIVYKGFEDRLTSIAEYRFNENPYILWQTYYFIPSVLNPYLKQRLKDIKNQLSLIPETKTHSFLQEQKEIHLKKVTNLSTRFCDRNFVFDYLKENVLIDREYIIGSILSDMLENLNAEEYAQYIKFDYPAYTRFQWEFEMKDLSDYQKLEALSRFDHLIRLLNSIFLLKELEQMQLATPNKKKAKKTDKVRDNDEDTQIQTEGAEAPQNKSIPDEKLSVKQPKADYLLDISLLINVYEEFNAALWEDMGLPDFLNVFRNTIEPIPDFKVRDVSRFYFLLKHLWKHRSDTSLYRYEKEWLIPFLETYNLSHSSYSNQFIEKEGAYNHRVFIQTVENIFKKSKARM